MKRGICFWLESKRAREQDSAEQEKRRSCSLLLFRWILYRIFWWVQIYLPTLQKGKYDRLIWISIKKDLPVKFDIQYEKWELKESLFKRDTTSPNFIFVSVVFMSPSIAAMAQSLSHSPPYWVYFIPFFIKERHRFLGSISITCSQIEFI